ncbi:TetR/AcrR family transcriptional regulator [Chryseobacterium soli]|uniref:TetR/AcrR family transcriptional regulator n=1 Tax=Chryseobacterium soli TaxID=445961 RepID=UPI002953149C|nr:TetR/AcrR family transcriptional regulator [Chryseobacterium soli]MDV7695928.1 TetR/AcrR family transcriptional regulator [Chryseobacterium soli]
MKKSAATRLNILQKAFELIYTNGYQTTSVDEIIATTQVTKGAFYYHFKTKDEMGLAIINEHLKPSFKNTFVEPIQRAVNPLDGIYQLMENLLIKNELLKVEYGCPASNFTQEMAPWHIEFTKALNELALQWKNAMIESIEKGKETGIIQQETDAEGVAVFVMSGYWGVRNLGKLDNNTASYITYLKQLKSYFKTLQ